MADFDDGLVLSPPSVPMDVARELLERDQFATGDILTLRRWRNGWMRWVGARWVEAEDASIRSELYQILEGALFEKETKNGTTVERWAPTKRKIADLLEAMEACTHLAETVDDPAWLDGAVHSAAGEMVACANGLLHVGSRELTSHTPSFFNRVSVPFDYDPEAREPVGWLRFLDQLWPDDPDSIATLQEWFGYVLSGRTDLQKILLMVGPTRSGKGTIARILAALIGKGNAAGPTLASLGTNFGLSPLLGKPLAVVSDARLSGANVSAVVERLLSISGEDMLTVDRKYRDPWTGKLPSRFVILSNELPRFGDASGAIANRFVVLQMHESFLGRENPRLTEQLYAELPGILCWALDGLDRIRNRSLTMPQSSMDAVTQLQDLVSPVAAFVRDGCKVDIGGTVSMDELFAAWRSWCEDNGHRAGSKQTFGRDLRAVVPHVRMRRPRDDAGSRYREWIGITLRSAHNGEHRGPTRTKPGSGAESDARSAVVRDKSHCGSSTNSAALALVSDRLDAEVVDESEPGDR